MIDVMQIQKILPHRYPFLLVDKIVELKVKEIVRGYKNISISDHVFMGHFPDHPIYPGVLILEGMAQTGGVLAFESMDDKVDPSSKVVYFTGIDNAKFRNPVRPGDRLDYEMSVVKNRGNMWIFQGKAFVDNQLVAEAELKAMIVDK
ncbi:3-hydroxyacyl-ACP dehydratase FabZ [Campylobacter insulaenigrae]|uniref:3-hydroxyacyl-[acyl-carrier-protein] dehydratase FabZ n=2 Tax=Campylobacter insulaenigrae TaxID=260714 RepID=A0A0A8H2I2_9BACT|nr:3-hydroxyacyl-ACP dehydratase FabZ [Campylobacter insulaenigrae]AJC88301.1 3-hydroxyacyl-[acp] dehydratase [Campylobacter insulaenigrae NCTC 12927]MCR6570971.1 3-hydroxyacyl-ACP dehydratase FabZ [Campylobacter insulaenigrae]MCR6572609.1 3-hydroxyacyl-ACP dehydratase FabZ [Campylobacter insulaenigrae]MCR6573905.1 3-hydroxyacyl-ACP dehydratase FabZ [Campylobacter insulaenigrae]MCR6575701.1 3-hydroxyacyl-ACP dehydratase FabZ [Campylobacter insulaenigrae]